MVSEDNFDSRLIVQGSWQLRVNGSRLMIHG